MDSLNLKILELLQQDAGMAVAEIAENVGLSTTPCWRRINMLEEQGVIRQRVTLLERNRLNLEVTAIVGIRTSQHDEKWFKRFSTLVDAIPEVIEFYRMSGEIDYLLKVVIPNISAFDAIYKQLIKVGGLLDVSTSFAMEELKCTTRLPLNYAKDT